MTNVLIASQPNGSLQNTRGDAQSDPVEFRALDGTAPNHFDGTLVAHYADAAGTSPLTTPVTADVRGRIMRYIAAGAYKQIVRPGTATAESLDFHATPGSVGSRVEIIDELAWAHDPAFGGAEMDDPTVNNDVAIRAGIDVLDAYAGDASLEFVPGKVYGMASSAVITGKTGVTLKGNGATLKHIPGLVLQSGADVGTFGNYQKCDLSLKDINIDVNNIERYGGFQLNGCTGLYEDVFVFDSNLNSSWRNYDHYGLVFNKADDGTLCTNIRMINVTAEDVELVEIDNFDGLFMRNCISRRAAGTCAVGMFSVGNGYIFRNADIDGLYIEDPRIRGLSITHETGGPNNNFFERIFLRNVVIQKLTSIGGVSSLLTIGNAGGAPSSGNVYEDIWADVFIRVASTLAAAGTATTVSGTPDLTVVTPTTKWQDGMPVVGAGIPAGTTILSGSGTAHMIMSANASASASGVSIVGYPLARPAFSINPNSGQDFLRAKIDATVIADCGPSQWADELKYLTDSEVKLKVRGATLGANLVGFTNCTLPSFDPDGSTTDAQTSGSLGSNVIELADGRSIIGTPHATDVVVGLPDINAGAPWRHEINVFTSPSVQTNFSTLTQSSTAFMGGRKESSGAQNDAIGWDVSLSAGTWSLQLIGVKGTDKGIFTVSIDGVTVGTIDMYNGVSVVNSLNALSGIVVATGGKKRLLLTMATKNASSSSYFGFINAISLLRTA